MKVIAQRGDDYLLVPDDAEPGDNVDGVIVEDDETEVVNAPSVLARGYWEGPDNDVRAEDVLPESFESIDTTDSKLSDDEVIIKGLTDQALSSIEAKYNVEVER